MASKKTMQDHAQEEIARQRPGEKVAVGGSAKTPIGGEKAISEEKDRLLYRENGQPMPLMRVTRELLLNALIPFRERAKLAEGRLVEKQNEAQFKVAEAIAQKDDEFEQRYGKPNNYGGQNGFTISPVNIADIEVVWNNEAVIIRFGDRRIAPRIKEWFANHRNVLPENEQKKPSERHKRWRGGSMYVLTNGMEVSPGEQVRIGVKDERDEITMRIIRIEEKPDGLWVFGYVPKYNIAKFIKQTMFTKQTIVHEGRVRRYASADERI